jgi:hypothetical protein
MKINEIILNVTPEEIQSTLDFLNNENDKYLFISNNLFSFKNICTCLKVREHNTCLENKYVSFKFSYNDKNLNNMITVKLHLLSESCLSYLKESALLNDEQIDAISAKIHQITRQSKINIFKLIERADEIVYNEALLILGRGVHNDDFELIKSNFESNYNIWKDRQKKTNISYIQLLNDLYNKIVTNKLKEKI